MVGISSFEVVHDGPYALAHRAVEIDKDRQMRCRVIGCREVADKALLSDQQPDKPGWGRQQEVG